MQEEGWAGRHQTRSEECKTRRRKESGKVRARGVNLFFGKVGAGGRIIK